MDVSIIIPCYNDAAHLAANVALVLEVLGDTPWEHEIILVDDVSPDECAAEIDRIIAAHPGRNIRKIIHEVNTGRGGAVNDGLRLATGKVAGFLDIDLEVGAHYIPAMVRAVQADADVAVGWRIYKLRWRILHRVVLSKGYHLLANQVLGSHLADTESGYKFFRRDKILPIIDTVEDNRWFWDTEVMVRAERAGLKIHFLPVLFIRRPEKPSTVRLVGDTIDYLRNLWRFRRSLAAAAPTKPSTTP